LGDRTKFEEIGMAAIGFGRPAAAFFAAVSLAATIAAFAIGQARAQQTVNPVPAPPPPTFNPSTPNTVPQAPYVPVSPSAPSGLSGSAPTAAPGTPAIAAPPSVTPQTADAPEEAKPALTRKHARHHGRVHYRWRRRHGRYHARPLGPAYYPGVGEFDPPYPNVCHFVRVWSGYYAGLWSSYGCW
jgi:hypothetical protein